MVVLKVCLEKERGLNMSNALYDLARESFLKGEISWSAARGQLRQHKGFTWQYI